MWYNIIKFATPSIVGKIVYHGTSKQFDSFDPLKSDSRDAGIWFHENETVARGYGADYLKNPRTRVIRAKLDIKNPIVFQNRDVKITPEIIEELKAMGYDGVKRELGLEGVEWGVFDPSQIQILGETNETYEEYQQRRLKDAKTAQVYGEYWIDESGRSMYADGDVGEYDHSTHVREQIASDYFEMSETDLYEIMNMSDEELSAKGMSPEEINVIKDREDPRTYAMKNWGWVRIQDKYVQAWVITSTILKNIAEGLFDAFGNEAFNKQYEIESLSRNKIYSSVPYEVIDSGKPGALRYYEYGAIAYTVPNGILKKSQIIKLCATANQLRQIGVEVNNGIATLYRGTNIKGMTKEDLRYGDFLSSVPSGTDVTGNLGADSYGKYVEEYHIPVQHIKITNGELQYVGPSKSLSGGTKYPPDIYKAFNDAFGSNFTAEEIDKEDFSYVRNVASGALSGGREEFDLLMAREN